jgi:hypothetical protein
LKVQTCSKKVLCSAWCFIIESNWAHTPNEWNTFQQLHTNLEAIVLSNRMKELIRRNKFRHKLGPVGYKAAIPLWAKKEQ